MFLNNQQVVHADPKCVPRGYSLLLGHHHHTSSGQVFFFLDESISVIDVAVELLTVII